MILGLDHASDRFHLVCRSPLTERHMRFPKSSKLTADQKRSRLAPAFGSALHELVMQDAQDRLDQGLADPDYYVHLFAEEPLALSNPQTTRALSLAAGAYWDRHLGMNVAWFWIEVSKWTSWCGIKQNLKTEVRKALAREWAIAHGAPEDGWEEDHYDSFCIGAYGEHLLLQNALAC